jgi:hypothetical protein
MTDTTRMTKDLIAKRVKVGAGSPAGRRYSNLVGQLQEVPELDSDWRRTNLLAAIQQQVAEAAQIQRDGGRYVHGNHGAAR